MSAHGRVPWWVTASADATPASGMPSESADGSPHLTYFAEHTSFVWSGGMDRPVEVCPGGYGEPVGFTFDIREYAPDRGRGRDSVFGFVAAADVLAMFQAACDQWLRVAEGQQP